MAANKKKKALVKNKKASKAKAKSKAPASKGKIRVVAKSKSLKKEKTSVGRSSKSKKPTTPSRTNIFASLQAFMTPLDNRVVVRIDVSNQQKTAGGVWLPPSNEQKPQRGQVLAVGRGRRNKKGQVFPMDVTVGDEVLYGAFSGTSVEWEGAQILILREDEILGVLSAT